MKRIGIYSGTFDPLHDGHLGFAQAALQENRLETVIFIPERAPRHKPHASPYISRLNALHERLSDTPFIALETPDDHLMTATLLPLLHTTYPDHSFVFLLGSDTAVHSLPRWTRLELLRPYRFVVGMRTTETPEAVRAVFQQLHFNGTIIQSPLPNLSSSSIRQLTKY